MKKIKAILVLSAILFLCAFVFAACGPKESGYVGMLQFGNGSWDYSDKVTFNLGKADGSKDLDSYLKKNAGIKNVKFEDYLSQDKTMTVKIKLDTDILDKTLRTRSSTLSSSRQKLLCKTRRSGTRRTFSTARQSVISDCRG